MAGSIDPQPYNDDDDAQIPGGRSPFGSSDPRGYDDDAQVPGARRQVDADDLIKPEDVSVDMLKELFDGAYMETRIDEDGDLHVKERIGCFILPSKTGSRLHMLSLFGANNSSSLDQRLQFANRVNAEMAIVRACVRKKGDFAFDAYIPVEGGIPARTIVMFTKTFLSATISSIQECDKEDVVE